MSAIKLIPTLLLLVSVNPGIASCAFSDNAEIRYIVTNKPKHISDNFSIQSIPPSGARLTREKRNFKKYKTLTINYSISSQEEPRDSRSLNRDYKCIISYLKTGINITDCELYKNDIPIGNFLEISYLGLIGLRRQAVIYSEKFAANIVEIKEVDSFPTDLINAKIDSRYKFRGKWGQEGQVFGLLNENLTFTTKKIVPASQISPNLSGDALEIEIARRNDNGIVYSKFTHYYIMDYGIAVRVSFKNSTTTDVYSVKSIEIN